MRTPIQPVAGTTKNPIGKKLSHHNLKKSRNNVGHYEKVYLNARQKHGRQPGDDMPEIDVKAMICVSATMKAAVRLGQDYQDNLRTTMNTDFEKVKQLYDISLKMTLGQSEEIFGISTSKTPEGRSAAFSHSPAF